MYHAAELTEIQRKSLHSILHIQHIVVLLNIFLAGGKPVSGKEKMPKKIFVINTVKQNILLVVNNFLFLLFKRCFFSLNAYTKTKFINILL